MTAAQLIAHLRSLEPDAEIIIPIGNGMVGPCSGIKLDRFVPARCAGRQWCELEIGTDFGQDNGISEISK